LEEPKIIEIEVPTQLKIKINEFNNTINSHSAEIDDIIKRYLKEDIATPHLSVKNPLMSMFEKLSSSNKPSYLGVPMTMTPMTMDTIPMKQPIFDNSEYPTVITPMNDMYGRSTNTNSGFENYAANRGYETIQVKEYNDKDDDIYQANSGSTKINGLSRILNSFTTCTKCGREFLKVDENDISNNSTCYLCR